MNHSMKYNPIHNKENTNDSFKMHVLFRNATSTYIKSSRYRNTDKELLIMGSQSLFTDIISLVLTNTGFSKMSKTAGCHAVIREH